MAPRQYTRDGKNYVLFDNGWEWQIDPNNSNRADGLIPGEYRGINYVPPSEVEDLIASGVSRENMTPTQRDAYDAYRAANPLSAEEQAASTYASEHKFDFITSDPDFQALPRDAQKAALDELKLMSDTQLDTARNEAIKSEYQSKVGRPPTAEELVTARTAITQGKTLSDAITFDQNEVAANTKNVNSASINDAFQSILGRAPTTEEASNLAAMMGNGVTATQMRNMVATADAGAVTTASSSAADAAKYGIDQDIPVYGTEMGGKTLPNTPDIASLGDVPVAGALAEYGDEVNGFNDIRYGDTIGNNTLAKFGDAVAGYNPVKYGENIRGVGLAKYGDTIAGNNKVDYTTMVANPMDDWSYEATPAFKAKNELTQTALMNSMSARGIRGASAANAAADQTRKLVGEDYTNERDYAFNQLLNKYKAEGLEYEAAYNAATNEYKSMYGAASGEYNNAYSANTDEYNRAYTMGQNEYTTALDSKNQATQGNYINQTNNYNQRNQNLMNQYGLDLSSYTDMYTNRRNENNESYNRLMNELMAGAGATQFTASAGANAANNTSQYLQNAGSAAAAGNVAQGSALSTLYSGLGKTASNFFGNSSVQQGLSNLWKPSTTTQGYMTNPAGE